MSQHVSMLVLDALAAGQLPADEQDAARTHVAACPRCAGDLAQAEAAVSTFRREVFPRTIDAIGSRVRPRPWWQRMAPLLVPVVAAAALLLWLNRKPDAPSIEETHDDIRVKGAITFKVFAKRGDSVISVVDRAKLASGDAIRFIAAARSDRYLIVGSVDGRGKATIYFPYNGTRSAAVTSTPTELPGSIVLDDAPGPERLFALFSTEPLEAPVVTTALTALGARGADAIRAATVLDVRATHQATLAFEKETK